MTLVPGIGARETSTYPLPKRRLMVVAQSPGDPARQFRPKETWPMFRKLEEWMQMAGFYPGMSFRCWVTNAYPYHVDRLNIFHITGNQEWLMEQVREVDPDVIMTLGVIATVAIAGPLSAYRRMVGKVLTIDEGRERKVIVFPHTSGRSRVTNTDEGKAQLAEAIRHLRWYREFYRLDS